MPIRASEPAFAGGRCGCGLSRRLAPALVAACLIPGARAGGEEAGAKAIQATIRVEPALAGRIAPGDRLVLKLYHPGEEVELDAKYRLIDNFSLPLEVVLVPAIDMSGRTKFQDYVVEAFTDRDGDVLKVVPGELGARTAGPVPLGTTGLVLELSARRE